MDRREFGRRVLAAAGASLVGASPAAALGWRPGAVEIDGVRLLRHLAALSRFGERPEGGVSRVAFSEADRQGREYVVGLMRAAGLEVEVDAAANLIGRRAGRDASLPPLAFGSHIDSVPQGGNYDGPVGSLAAIEVAQSLQERELVTRHPLEVIVFTNEEGGKTGSRVLDGEFRAEELALPTASGKSIEEGIAFLGGDPGRLGEARRAHGSHAAFVELHIEQGAVLEQTGAEIGVVEGIVGIRRWEVTVEGFANHAGTTPMSQRQDALLAAARYVDRVNQVVSSTPGTQVGTVGRLQVSPGAPNVIPGVVTASLELRDLEMEKLDRLFARIEAEARSIGEQTGTRFHFRRTYESRAALSDPGVQRTIAAAAAELGLSTRAMPSGAGHDAQSMARLGPMGMIFVPSVGGISHSPREFTHPRDVVNGARVLLRTLLALDGAAPA